MAERNWEDELQQFLKGRFHTLADRFFMQVPSGLLKIAPPLHQGEARWFILGLEAGLFAIDGEGFVDCLLVPPPDDQVNRERLRIFLADSLPPRLSRETVCLLSAVGSLVLKHGWLPRQIEIWPASGADSVTAGGVDLVVKSLSGELLAGVEVKRTAPELTKLKSDLHQCCKRGRHPEANCGFPQNHGNFEFCAACKPKYFCAVAPGAEICFKVTCGENDVIQLEEFSSIPPRSIVELAAAG